MEAGRLRHRVTVQRAVDVTTDSGAVETRYVDLFDTWAEVLPLTPREQMAAAQVQSDITAKIRIRYRPGLDARCRVTWRREAGSPSVIEVFDVEGPPVEVQGRRADIWLMCRRRDAEGFRGGEP
jgi:SPP1 family predicted phage head-tail adaptor